MRVEYHPWDGDVDFQTSRVCMGRHISMGTGGPGDARPSCLEKQLQGQIDLASQASVTRVESSDINVRGRKGQDAGAVFPLI